MSLNRTSVGLKLSPEIPPAHDNFPPQSNQRGIETGRPEARAEAEPGGLNRTSVGLKPSKETLRGKGRGSLNRTSVGLKPRNPRS